MITKITLKKVASYKDIPAILETDKKVNLVYGLNGTGKTTISKYLQNRSNPSFSDCSIGGLNDEKILVYNQKFIDDNFYLSPTQKGIFSLKSENKEAKEKIDKALENIKSLRSQIKNDELKTGFQFDLQKRIESLDDLQSETEDKLFEIKTKYSGGDRVLEFCLEGKKIKKNLFDYISGISKPVKNPEKTILDLKKEAESTQGENAKTYDETLVKKVNFDFGIIENNQIFQEVIVGNENSQIAEFITKLNNSDWVKKGREFMKEPRPEAENEKCPFCQKKTISKELYQEIQNYFDETYQGKVTELENLDKEYWREYQNIKKLENEFLQIDFIRSREIEFKLLFKNFIDKLSSNWSKINNKIKNPTIVVSLESTTLEQHELNNFLDAIIAEIKIHNEKINNKQETKEQIIKDFWSIMRWDYDQTIENHKIQKSRLEKEKDVIEKSITELNLNIKEEENVIIKSRKETVSIQDAINTINSELIFFGLDGFSIIPVGEDNYRLCRPDEDTTKFETLSEGEKTVISFLYFLELCKGNEKDDEIVKEKIVVIDDPISSLSHMYVFNVAQLIKKNFFNDKYSQTFILTHNLYFFHELVNIGPRVKDDKYKFDGMLFRVLKQDGRSSIKVLGQSEIQNEYQSYWAIIKDCTDDDTTKFLLANSMRNILEYFFAFLYEQRLSDMLNKIDKEEKYQFFARYMNRESHSDAVNISDIKDIDISIFNEAFKKVFEKTNNLEHYKKMMGE